jgi:uncharacterized protein (DUF58 family)
VERIGRLGLQRAPLEYSRRRAFGRYVLRGVPRGAYVYSESRVVVEDPFGLAHSERPLLGAGALVVYPRLVELEKLFSESGGTMLGGAAGRLLVRRPAGVELHSVRDYQEGESLRAVHWPSTAKRARLMVKDLEDAPRDDLAVVLDARAGAASGESFDVQVRAAGSILQLYARRGRRAVLIITSTPRQTQRVRSHEGDWRAALELLAAAEASGRGSLSTALDEDGALATYVSDLVLVTSRLDGATAETLLRLASGRRLTVVYVDSTQRPEPLLLHLQAAGIAVAVVRRGDDLAAVLGAAAPKAAHG